MTRKPPFSVFFLARFLLTIFYGKISMTTIGVTNRKGGSGKTTTSVNLAAALAITGARVLLVDADPQAHSALSLGMKSVSGEKNLFDVLVGGTDVRAAFRMIPHARLSVLFGGRRLLEFERDYSRINSARTALLNALSRVDADIDYVLIDTPPTLRLLTVCSIVASSHVIVPMQMHFLAMEGLAETVRILRGIQTHFGRTVEFLGVVPTFFSAHTRLSQAVISDIRQTFGERSILHPIRPNIALAEAPGHGKSVFHHAPRSHGAADYLALANQIQMETRDE